VVNVDGKPSGLLTRQDVLTFLAAAGAAAAAGTGAVMGVSGS
jgi:hypothetical protein